MNYITDKEQMIDIIMPDVLMQIVAEYLPINDFLHIRDNIAKKLNINILKNTKSVNLPSIDNASREGHLEVVKYLHSIGKECTTNAMDYASSRGHIEVVQYLHSIGKECTTRAIDFAGRNGHLEVVKYLHSIGKKFTMAYVSREVHIEVACCSPISSFYWTWPVKEASNGHIEIVYNLRSIEKEKEIGN